VGSSGGFGDWSLGALLRRCAGVGRGGAGWRSRLAGLAGGAGGWGWCRCGWQRGWQWC
jgi:hypothetical protein